MQPPPKDEDEMMQNVYEVVDRLFLIARPRKVLYLAVGEYIVASPLFSKPHSFAMHLITVCPISL